MYTKKGTKKRMRRTCCTLKNPRVARFSLQKGCSEITTRIPEKNRQAREMCPEKKLALHISNRNPKKTEDRRMKQKNFHKISTEKKTYSSNSTFGPFWETVQTEGWRSTKGSILDLG